MIKLLLPLLVVLYPRAFAQQQENYKLKALAVLTTAIHKNTSFKKHFEKAIEALKKTQVKYVQPGEKFKHCLNPENYAVFNYADESIYVCPDLLKENENLIVQTLIHESVHAAGYRGARSECLATRVEHWAMVDAQQAVQKVGYDCDLSR